MNGWIIDNSAAARRNEPVVHAQLAQIADSLYICPVGELEQLYSARSGREYDAFRERLGREFNLVDAPLDIFDRTLRLQRDLAHHHGLWHRIHIPDLIIAETALYHDLGVVHVDGDFGRIAEVRPLVVRRLG